MGEAVVTVSRAAFEALTTSCAELSRVVRQIEQSQSASVEFPGWESSVRPYIPLGFQTLAAIRATGANILEDGPPELPQDCVFFASCSLSNTLVPKPEIRALRAYRLGFWDKKSVECDVKQLQSSEVSVILPTWHWIVLRAKDWKLPVRFDRKADFDRFSCQEVVEVAQEFSSLAEVEIYCFGAAIEVPHLLRWRNLR